MDCGNTLIKIIKVMVKKNCLIYTKNKKEKWIYNPIMWRLRRYKCIIVEPLVQYTSLNKNFDVFKVTHQIYCHDVKYL